MNYQNVWKSFAHNMQNAFTLVEEGGSAPARLNIRAILSCALRLILYGIGTVLAYFGLVSVLSSWHLDSLIVGLGGTLVLILAGVGLFFFFRRGYYRRGLKWTDYFWWIFGSIFVLFVLFALIVSLVHSDNATQLDSIAGSAFDVFCGVDLMVIAYVRGKAPRIVENPPLKSENDTKGYKVIQPQYHFSELILSLDLLKELRQAVDIIQTPEGGIEAWGLPVEARVAYVALHLYGKPGTGKTLAAHALAEHLGQQILTVAYADFQAEYYSETNKKIQAAFDVAASNNALLFIDESDTLLTHGVSQIISSQVRASLEQFHGVVIFATNSIETYNKAFETRVRHIHFPMPDEECRVKLWQVNLPDTLPRSADVDPVVLARQFGDLSGREIKRIIAEAAQVALTEQQPQLELKDVDKAVTRLKKGRLHEDSDVTIDSLAKIQYEARSPKYTFEQLVLSKSIEKDLLLALDILKHETKIFDQWGLRSIEPFPCTALNFHGPPGTGKTMAAHALAAKLNQNILVANYGEISGQLVGDSARNTSLIFRAAKRENAVLFIDEADALLARRLGNVAHSADMSMNSLSNQMLIALENFHGIVIFATNMIQNYDKAFETRLRYIHFPMPDEECRQRIWRVHLPESLPLAEDVDVVTKTLASQVDDICGREIKNAVIDAVTNVQAEERTHVELNDLFLSIKRIKEKRLSMDSDALREATREYTTKPALYRYEQLVLSKSVEDDLLQALDSIRDEMKVFDQWGLRSIEPFPSTALNFHGPPGTGKTLAAHALADRLGQRILVANYGDIVGRYVGDAARNTNAIFRTAARENAVLFIDEADALLASRLGIVAHSADMSLNALSNQMLIALENFHGVVIFATNIIQNYDKAFETRLRYIHFPMPDEECRQRIWRVHLPESLPLAEDVDPVTLARQVDDICGRDIKNAVIEAAMRVRRAGRTQVELHDLVAAIKRIKNSRVSQQKERGVKYKEVEERLQRQLLLEKLSPAPSSQQATRPLSDLLEQPSPVILAQPLIQIMQNDASGQPDAPETRVPQITRPLSDTTEETELDTPTQPLIRLGRNTSEQHEEMRN